VRDSFVLRDPNDEMGLLLGFQALEIVLPQKTLTQPFTHSTSCKEL